MESKNRTNFFPVLIKELKSLLKNPKKMIPTFVLCGVWLLFSLMSGFGVNIPVLRFFYTLTYANGGMLGGFFGTVGGIFGKAVFAAVINTIVLSICEKKNPFFGLRKGLKGTFIGSLSAIAPLLIGGGLGVLLYWFFNITSSPVNCAVAVVAAVGTLSAIGKKNGLLFSLIFGAMSRFSGGKTPSMTVVNRVITGFSLGFALAFPVTFIRLPLLLFLLGITLLIGGIVLVIVGKNGAKRIAAAAMLVLIVGASLLPVFTVSVSASELPPGFVDPSETLDFGSDIESTLYDENNTAAVFFSADEAESQLVKELFFSASFQGFQAEKKILWDISKVGISGQSFTVYRNENNDAVPIKGGASYSNPGTETGWEDHRYAITYHYELELYNFVFNDGEILADVRGTETYDYSVSGPIINDNGGETVTIDKKGKPLYAYRDPDTGLLKMSLSVDDGYGGLQLFFSVDGILPASGATSGGTSGGTSLGSIFGEYVPYRGRLTYTNGRKNKYGQPFPDLMDFDMDGDLDYADLVLQDELVHNPDYLDQPGSPAAIAVIAVLTVLLGGAGAIAGTAAAGIAGSAAAEVFGSTIAETAGETVGNAVSGIDDLGPYIDRDSDGDLNVTDPATGEKRFYKNNGDGTYTNPLTGATYTESELKSSLESRADNAGTIRQDAAEAEEAIASQHNDNLGLSQSTKDYEAEKAKQAAHDEYVEKLGEKYGVNSGDEEDIRAKIGYEQGKAEIESYEQQEYEGEMKNKQEYVETVEKVADTSIDVLADVTGRKDIKAAYTMAKNTVARTTEAYVNDKNVAVGVVQGAMEGAIGVVQDNVDGAGAKFVANVVGETYKEAQNAAINGENMTEAIMGGIGKGLVNTGVDVGMDMVGGGVKDMLGDAADDAFKNAFTESAEVTKGTIVDGAKTLANDLVKDGLDEAFKIPGED